MPESSFVAKNIGFTTFEGTFGAKNIGLVKFDGTYQVENLKALFITNVHLNTIFAFKWVFILEFCYSSPFQLRLKFYNQVRHFLLNKKFFFQDP